MDSVRIHSPHVSITSYSTRSEYFTEVPAYDFTNTVYKVSVVVQTNTDPGTRTVLVLCARSKTGRPIPD